MRHLISAYIGRAGGGSSENARTGSWIDLPVSEEALAGLLSSYGPYSIRGCDFGGVLATVDFKPAEQESIEDLNDLARSIANLPSRDVSAVAAASKAIGGRRSAIELSNLALQADKIPFREYDLGPNPPIRPATASEKLAVSAMSDGKAMAELSEEGLSPFFDFDGYGQYLIEKGYIALDDGYTEPDASMPSTALFSRDEIRRRLDDAEKQAEKRRSFLKTCDSFREDAGALEAWYREKTADLSPFIGDPPCWGEAYCIDAAAGGFVSEKSMAKALPLQEERDLYLVLSYTEGIGFESLFSPEEVALHGDDLSPLLERAEFADSESPFAEFLPDDFDMDDLVSLAQYRLDLFDLDSLEKWPRLSKAAEKAHEAPQGRRAHLRQVMSETAFGCQGYLQNAPWGSKESYEAYRSAQREYSSMRNVADEESGMAESDEKRGSSKRSPFELAEKMSQAYERERGGSKGGIDRDVR